MSLPSAAAQTEATCKWYTDEELGFVQDHEGWTARQIADELGRSVPAVWKMRKKLRGGATGKGNQQWTSDEDDVLLETAWLTAKQLMERLPGRSEQAIHLRRQRLGVTSPNGVDKVVHTIGARPLLAKTCTTCGKLLQADWFIFMRTSRQWAAACRKCRGEGFKRWDDRQEGRERAKPALDFSYSRLQAVTSERATRKGEPWTEADQKILADPDLTVLQKALKLGRTYAATSHACHEGGYRSHKGLGEPTDLWRIFNPNEPEAAA